MNIVADVEKAVIGITAGHATILATLAAVAGLAAGYFFWRDHVFDQGVAACEAKDALAKTAYDAKVETANAQTATAVAQGEAAVAKARADRPAAVRAAQAAAQAVPVFAKTQRPPELAAQRTRELAAIDKASQP